MKLLAGKGVRHVSLQQATVKDMYPRSAGRHLRQLSGVICAYSLPIMIGRYVRPGKAQ